MRTEGEIATNTDPTGPWSLVVPLKPLARAKSRLGRAVGGDLRPRLALAFAQDTVAAALSCPAVRDVVVVTDDPVAGAALAALGARAVADTPAAGLNAALEHGARSVRGAARAARRWPRSTRICPRCVRTNWRGCSNSRRHFPAHLSPTPRESAPHFFPRRPGVELRPAFGGPSRARHLASGAVEVPLAGVDSVRRDVDTGEDLGAALALGVGRFTAALAAPVAPAADR